MSDKNPDPKKEAEKEVIHSLLKAYAKSQEQEDALLNKAKKLKELALKLEAEQKKGIKSKDYDEYLEQMKAIDKLVNKLFPGNEKPSGGTSTNPSSGQTPTSPASASSADATSEKIVNDHSPATGTTTQPSKNTSNTSDDVPSSTANSPALAEKEVQDAQDSKPFVKPDFWKPIHPDDDPNPPSIDPDEIEINAQLLEAFLDSSSAHAKLLLHNLGGGQNT